MLPKPFSRDQLYSMLEVRATRAVPCVSSDAAPLQRHLSHLKAAKRYAIHIPPSVGVPPLSDQGVNDALRYSAAHYDKILESYHNPEEVPMWNPLGGSGTSDAQFIQMIGVSRSSFVLHSLVSLYFFMQLQQSMNPNGGPIDFNQMMQTAASTAVEFTMMPSDAFAAGMGLAAGNVANKRDREDEQDGESSKRAKTTAAADAES